MQHVIRGNDRQRKKCISLLYNVEATRLGRKKCLQRWWEHDKVSLPEPITVKIPSQEPHFLSGNHLRERCSFFQLKQNRLILHTEIPCTVKCAPEITQTMKFSISRSMAQVLSKIVNGPVLKEETATYNKPCYRHDVSHELKRPLARLASCIGKYMSHARVQSDTSTTGNCATTPQTANEIRVLKKYVEIL